MADPNFDPSLQHYLNSIRHLPLLDAKEEAALARKARRGCEASRRRMIEANLRLAVKVALRYRRPGLEFADLISEANLGLMHAVTKFDPGAGTRFSTYAVHWIRHYLNIAVMKSHNTIRTPVWMQKARRQYYRELATLREELGRDPAAEEIAARMGITVKRLGKIAGAAAIAQSADEPRLEGSSEPLLAALPDPSPSHAEALHARQLAEEVAQLLCRLPPRQRDVIVRRFGFGRCEAATLNQLGDINGVCRERIRQLQANSLERLRRLLEIKGLTAEEIGLLD